MGNFNDVKFEDGVLSIEEIFEKNLKLRVPIYQRRYAWGKIEVEQLIRDIGGQFEKNTDYYIGTLVLSKIPNSDFYDIVDGQQRMTTLFLILHALEIKKDFKLELLYGARDEIQKFFTAMKKNPKEISENLDKKNGLFQINSNLKIIKNLIPRGNVEFSKYLLKNVKLIITVLPENLDVNKYFESMNTRGKQLEFHEILKAKFISKIKVEKEKLKFSTIWNHCSNMNIYLIKNLKDIENSNLLPRKLEDIEIGEKGSTIDKTSLKKILETQSEENIDEKDPSSDQNQDDHKFNSIINFPNFLCIVRKIIGEKENNFNLDDKNLLENFGYNEDNLPDSKDFILKMVQIRLLLDNFIIKRDTDKNDWKIKRYLRNKNKNEYYKNTFSDSKEEEKDDGIEEEISDKIRQIQAMLQVSFPTQTYKNWLFHSLEYLFNEFQEFCKKSENSVTIDDFKKQLLKDNIFYTELRKITRKEIMGEELREDSLNKGTSTPHAIFHLLDFLIWEEIQDKDKNSNYLDTLGIKDSKSFEEWSKTFKFRYANSIEHIHPQTGSSLFDEKLINYFGNLCLINQEFNSSLSNHSFEHKKVKFKEHCSEYGCSSLKQAIIFSNYSSNKVLWDDKSIENHGEKMKELLKKYR